MPVLGAMPGGAPAESNRIPMLGDHTPGVGTEGGTAARTGWGAVSGATGSEGRAWTGGGGWDGGWEGGGAAYVA